MEGDDKLYTINLSCWQMETPLELGWTPLPHHLIRDSQQKEKKGRKREIRIFLYQLYPIYKINNLKTIKC